ncbi:MAG: hypothetical protein KF718_12955 [Polyangiaceae bacterium]|nr:hypothetical protein [Polyangiaceae bacterium]
MYALFSKERQVGLKHQIGELRNAQRLKKGEWQKAKAALNRAMRARKKGGFFKRLAKKCLKVARYAAVAAAVAFAIGTGGAGAVGALAIAGAVLSCTAMAQSEFGILQKMGMSDELAGKVEWGLAAGSAACSLGAGGAALFGAPAKLSAFGSALGFAAAGVQGVTTAAAGYLAWQAAEEDGNAAVHESDAVAARAEEARFERMFMQIMSEIEASEASDQRTLGHLRGAIEARDNAISMSTMKV